MTTPTQRSALPAGRRARPLVALAAALSPAAVWLIVVGIGGIDVSVPESFGSDTSADLELGAVIGASVIAVLLGWGLLVLLERLTPKALSIWTPVAAVVLVVSLPWSNGFGAGDRVVVALMHLVLAAILIVGLRRTAEPAA